MASALYVIGVVSIVLGIITGLYYGMNDAFNALGATQAIVGIGLMINGVVWGIVFFGFSEIIKLLQGIFNQNEPSVPKIRTIPAEPAVEKGKKKNEVSNIERSEIEEFYSAKGLTVQDIACTEREDYFMVTVDGKKEIVELGGFKPIVHPVN